MSRHKDYPDHATHRRRSVLPPKLQTDIVRLSKAIHGGKNVPTHLTSYILRINSLPASTVVRAAEEIRDAGGLSHEWHPGGGFWSFLRMGRQPTFNTELAALTKYPTLGYLFIFHGDGRLREAALKGLNEPPDSPFAFAAMTYRLNDWVQQVRDAAYDSASRLFPRVSATIIAEASLFLITQFRHLGRWGLRERQVLETALYRRDTMQALTAIMMQRPAGRVGLVLRQALIQPVIDATLPLLASNADLPQVRAIAYETLIMRRARWIVGYQYEWIDKRYGLRRRLPCFNYRPVEHELNIEMLLVQGAKDRSAAVKKVIAQGLIDLRSGLSPEMIGVGDLLSKDKARSVRSRAQFYLKSLPDI